jgi:hypothetical protein
MIDTKALWEAAKEPLRILVLAILPFVIAFFASLNYQWAVVATIVLRFIDKYLHEAARNVDKADQNTGLLGLHGLTGF